MRDASENFAHARPARVEAPRERIDAILADEPAVSELVDNEWIHLVAWAVEHQRFFARKP